MSQIDETEKEKTMSLSFYQAGITPVPSVGTYIELDNGAGGQLLSCDDWARAEFRFPVTSLRIPCAVNVQVTGRTIQRDGVWGSRRVRIAVTFVGDGEPDATIRGWMNIN